MRDVDNGDSQFPLDFLDLKAHGFPQLRIQVRQRFIQQEQLRLRHQRACQGNALLLAARELIGETSRILTEVHNFQHPFHTCADVIAGPLLNGQRIGHIVKYIHVRPDRIALEYHADIPSFRRQKGIPAGNQLVINVEFPAGGLFKSGNNAKHRGLSTAGRPKQCDKFSVFKDFIKLLEHHIVSKCLGDMINFNSSHPVQSFLR